MRARTQFIVQLFLLFIHFFGSNPRDITPRGFGSLYFSNYFSTFSVPTCFSLDRFASGFSASLPSFKQLYKRLLLLFKPSSKPCIYQAMFTTVLCLFSSPFLSLLGTESRRWVGICAVGSDTEKSQIQIHQGSLSLLLLYYSSSSYKAAFVQDTSDRI